MRVYVPVTRCIQTSYSYHIHLCVCSYLFFDLFELQPVNSLFEKEIRNEGENELKTFVTLFLSRDAQKVFDLINIGFCILKVG